MDVVAAQTKAIAGNIYSLLFYYLSRLYEIEFASLLSQHLCFQSTASVK
jgi:hypothetical protein